MDPPIWANAGTTKEPSARSVERRIPERAIAREGRNDETNDILFLQTKESNGKANNFVQQGNIDKDVTDGKRAK